MSNYDITMLCYVVTAFMGILLPRAAFFGIMCGVIASWVLGIGHSVIN